MQKRAVRTTLLALLLVTGLGAALLIWDIERRTGAVIAAERDVDTRLDRLMARAAALGAAQQAAVAPGQSHDEWLSRGSALLQQLNDDTAALGPRLRSTAAIPALESFAESLKAVVKADTRAREHLRAEHELMAAEVVFNEARQDIEGMIGTLRQIQEAERSSADEERDGLESDRAKILAAASAIWLAGLILFVRFPLVPKPLSRPEIPVAPAHEPVPAEVPARANVDMAAAADLCTAFSRVTSADELAKLLARAAAIVDASGIVVWLGAGEELFAATAYGYDERIVARLGAIRRSADNATAAAWRTGETRIVPGDMMGNGAIVAPLFGPDGCIGVLAAELRHGREQDENTRAVVVMIAAQLSAVVAAWPAPSIVEGPAPSLVDGVAPTDTDVKSATA